MFCLGLQGMLRFTGVGYSVAGCRVTLNGAPVPPRSLPPVVRLLEVGG